MVRDARGYSASSFCDLHLLLLLVILWCQACGCRRYVVGSIGSAKSDWRDELLDGERHQLGTFNSSSHYGGMKKAPQSVYIDEKKKESSPPPTALGR